MYDVDEENKNEPLKLDFLSFDQYEANFDGVSTSTIWNNSCRWVFFEFTHT